MLLVLNWCHVLQPLEDLVEGEPRTLHPRVERSELAELGEELKFRRLRCRI